MNKKDEWPKQFSRRLKSALAARGLREADVAKALGISVATVSRILRAQRRARAKEREKLETLLGYRIARLLRRRIRTRKCKASNANQV